MKITKIFNVTSLEKVHPKIVNVKAEGNVEEGMLGEVSLFLSADVARQFNVDDALIVTVKRA